MKIVGLTGSIGMGKTTTARLFEEEGARVFDADAIVAELYAPGGEAVEPVSGLCPEALVNGGIDRAVLSQYLQANPDKYKELETIVHPIVYARRQAFLDQAKADGIELIILDIPLLFETGREAELDGVVVVTAPEDIQKSRVMARPGMTEDKFTSLLARQMPDADKRKKADFIIDTSQGLDHAREQVRNIMTQLGIKPHA